MTKFWLMTKSTTAALCLLGIGANTALGMEALVQDNDLNDVDECETLDAFIEEPLVDDAIATENTLACNSSRLEDTEIWEETEALDNSDPVEFEEFSDPSWQEDNTAAWETAEPLPTETEAEWDTVPDAATEEWESPITMEELEAEWEVAPDVSAELEALPPTEAVATEWDDIPDAASENWDNRIEWDNVPDISATEEIEPAIATETHWENLEDDPQFQAVLEPETAKEEVAKLAPEDLIRDDRKVSELIVPTPEQQQAKTTGLPAEQVIRAAESNSPSEMTTALDTTLETPLLDRLDADLRRLRSQAEIVASQSLNTPIFAPQPITFETAAFNFNPDYGAVSTQELEQWAAKFEDELSFENEFAIDFNAIANLVDPQLFAQDLSELGLEVFDTTLLTGDAIASTLFFDGISFAASSLETIKTDFSEVLAGWEDAIGDASLTQDFTALIPAHLLVTTPLSFAGEMSDLNWQGEDIFAIDSAFEELPELNFGNHPFEFGFKRDHLQARLPLPSKKSFQ